MPRKPEPKPVPVNYAVTLVVGFMARKDRRVLKEGKSGPRPDYNAPTLYDTAATCAKRLRMAVKNTDGWVIVPVYTLG